MEEDKPPLDYGTNPARSSRRSCLVVAIALAIAAILLCSAYRYVFSSWHDMPP